MGVDIPQPFSTRVAGPGGGSIPVSVGGSLGAVGPVTVAGLPDTYHIHVEKLPKIQLGVDPVTINPVDVVIRLEMIPDNQAHLPANFSVGLSVLGMELMCVRLCGEAQVITEPYEPNPCERCGRPPRIANAQQPAVTAEPALARGPG